VTGTGSCVRCVSISLILVPRLCHRGPVVPLWNGSTGPCTL